MPREFSTTLQCNNCIAFWQRLSMRGWNDLKHPKNTKISRALGAGDFAADPIAMAVRYKWRSKVSNWDNEKYAHSSLEKEIGLVDEKTRLNWWSKNGRSTETLDWDARLRNSTKRSSTIEMLYREALQRSSTKKLCWNAPSSGNQAAETSLYVGMCWCDRVDLSTVEL